MTTLRRHTALALAVFLVAGGWGWHQQRHLARHRAERAVAETGMAETQRQQAEAEQQLDSVQQELARERSQRDAALAAARKGTREASERRSETRWTQPPTGWPFWEGGSPYVWLRKDALARLGVPAFTSDGSLTPELVTLLDLPPAARTALTDLARRLLTEWRTSEAGLAILTDQHPANIGKGSGPTVTVRVPPQPELAARLRREFNAVSREVLGEQRASFLAEFSKQELAEELGPEPSATEPPVKAKTYSVRHDGNIFQIARNIPSGSSLSTSTPDWRRHIPAHLHALFTKTFGEEDAR